MRARTHCKPKRAKALSSIVRALVCTSTLATIGLSYSGAAAEIDLSVSGTFKPPPAEQMANLPADIPFSQADLASGTWSFFMRYEDSVADADPDPFVGRYVGAIHRLRLTIGNTTMDFPIDRAELVVSDGGRSAPNRESIQVEATSASSFGVMHAGWVQINQPPNRLDLRGSAGSLTSDALPDPSVMAHLTTSSLFDRFLLLRIDRANDETHPLLYISSSNVVAVTGAAVTK